MGNCVQCSIGSTTGIGNDYHESWTGAQNWVLVLLLDTLAIESAIGMIGESRLMPGRDGL